MRTKSKAKHLFSMSTRRGRIAMSPDQAASLALHFVGLAASVSLPAFATALALGGGLLFAPVDAQAGTCVQSGATGTFTCSGPASPGDVEQIPTDLGTAPLIVTTTGGFGISTAQGNALTINGTSLFGATFTDNNASVIRGDAGGIVATSGAGPLLVTSTGTVTGNNGVGITSYNVGNNLTVSANNTTGGVAGIYAIHVGTGTEVIRSTGTARGGRRGILGLNVASSAGNDLIITAKDAIGGETGIFASNRGRGSVLVTVTGAATGVGGSTGTVGVYAENSQYGSETTLFVNDATGDAAGIFVKHAGAGPATVNVTGRVTGGNVAGIFINSAAATVNLASTATVGTSAGGSGYAILDGSGKIEVTINRGTVNGAILLGAGSDTLTIAAGTPTSGITTLSGNGGATPPPPPPPGGGGQSTFAPSSGTTPEPDGVFTLGASLAAVPDIDTLNLNAGFAGSISGFEVIDLNTTNTNSFTVSSAISDATSLTKNGAGTLTLSGLNTFTGQTTVTGGSLNVTGMMASSPITLQAGAMLTGTGTVGAVMAQSGATISPGSAPGGIGTLTVNGNLTFMPGSTFAIDVSPTSQDRVNVSGAATLGGANLVVTPNAATGFGQSVTILSANSITGNFATPTLAGAFASAFSARVVINGASAMLQLAPNSLVMLGGSALRGNALAVATAFDTAVRGGFNPQAFMGLFAQGANLPVALNQFTGEIHSAERRVALEDTRIVREAVFDRLGGGGSAPAGSQTASKEDGERTITLWTQGVASTSKAQADGIGSRFTSDRTGFLFGGDVATNGFTFGGLFSYVDSDIDLARRDSSKVKSVGGALYAGYRQPGSGFAVGAGGAIADNRFKGRRAITAPGVLQSLKNRSGGTTYQLFGEVSYDLAAGEATRIEPFVRFAYAKLDAGNLAETGGVAAVSAGKQGNDLTTTAVGVRGAYAIGKATLSGSAAYQHSGGDRSAPTDLSIIGATGPFRVRSVALDRNAAALEARASFRLAPRVTLGIGYSGVIGSNNTDHGGRGTLTFAW